jgi:hypothetical protein
MVKLWHLTLTLIVVFGTLIGSVHWIGRAVAAPLIILFTNPDGTPCKSPCLFGVRPGVMSYESAIQLLHKHPFTRKFEPNFAGTMLHSGDMSLVIYLEIYLRGSEALVSQIDLANDSPSSPVASWGSRSQVIAALGMPDRVITTDEFTLSCYHADQLIVTHWTGAPNQVITDDRLARISVSAPSRECKTPAPGAPRPLFVER